MARRTPQWRSQQTCTRGSCPTGCCPRGERAGWSQGRPRRERLESGRGCAVAGGEPVLWAQRAGLHPDGPASGRTKLRHAWLASAALSSRRAPRTPLARRPPPPLPTATCSASIVERLSGAFAQVIATLQQPLLSDVGIKCTNREGLQQLHRCRDQAARQFGAWSGGPAVPSRDMAALLGHVMQVEVSRGGRRGGPSWMRPLAAAVASAPAHAHRHRPARCCSQEALWRLDQVLEQAMTGVRLGDGTTWVKNRGYTWVLGKYMADKLYPQGGCCRKGRRVRAFVHACVVCADPAQRPAPARACVVVGHLHGLWTVGEAPPGWARAPRHAASEPAHGPPAGPGGVANHRRRCRRRCRRHGRRPGRACLLPDPAASRAARGLNHMPGQNVSA